VEALRTAYRYLAALIFLGVLAQIGAAGYGAFYASKHLEDKGDTLGHEPWDNAWNAHGIIGTVVIIAMVVLLVIALLARFGRPAIWLSLALAVAGVVQMGLAALGTAVPGLGFLHPLNALVIFTLSGLIAHRTWRARTSP
jgi:Family of unknown function (DUF6220)